MRGAPPVSVSKREREWIIPADAGSTMYRVYTMPYKGDHPRGCGEHALGSPDLADAVGSSPRMRGAHIDRKSVV